MKASAIIVAAGSGQRLGASEPKAFVRVGGRAMLSYSLRTIASVEAIGEIVIAVPGGWGKAARAEADAAGVSIPVKITVGGAERQDSVRIALALTSADAELVIIHDAARPLASAEILRACLDAANVAGGAIAAIPVSDTLKQVAGATISATVPRAGLWQAQTPQAFRRDLLVAAHARAVEQKIAATDDADLVERYGGRVDVVECATANLKITTRADLEMVEAMLSRG